MCVALVRKKTVVRTIATDRKITRGEGSNKDNLPWWGKGKRAWKETKHYRGGGK